MAQYTWASRNSQKIHAAAHTECDWLLEREDSLNIEIVFVLFNLHCPKLIKPIKITIETIL